MLILSISSFFSSFLNVLIAISALMIMVMFHEMGHYIAGKTLGFKINEFSIGFGKAIYSRKAKSGEKFSIRMIPLGGFCAFEGEDEDNVSDMAFNNQKPWKRVIVLVSGVIFNVITAVIVFAILFMSIGYAVPKVYSTYELDSGGANILQEDDLIVKVDGKNVYSLYSSNLSELITKSGDSIDMTIIRDGEEMNVTAIRQGYTFINEEEEIVNREGIGIQISYANYNYGFFGSIWRGVVSCGQVVKLIVETLGKLFTGLIGVKGNLAGPVTTIGAISEQTASYGIIGYLSVLAVISISVAFTNILPLPALDGSRIVFVIVEWIRKKPINRKIEGMIHAIGLIVLFSLTILLDLLNYV